jgi:hypothetical protein
MSDSSDQDVQRARRRLRGFGLHIAGYFVVVVALAAINMLSNPENPWFVWPMVGWGGVLAVHAAFAMGLFGGSGEG